MVKTDLDKRICDVEISASNTETYREYIANSENELGIKHNYVDNMDEVSLNAYIKWIDEMWNK